MNQTEHLLTVLAEEGSEVAQQACKANRFGLSDCEPGGAETNKRRIEREMAQALAVFEMLGYRIREYDKVAKKVKVRKYMKYARRRGTLQ